MSGKKFNIIFIDLNQESLNYITDSYNKNINSVILVNNSETFMKEYKNFHETTHTFYDLVFINIGEDSINYNNISTKIKTFHPNQEIIIYNTKLPKSNDELKSGFEYFLIKQEDSNSYNFNYEDSDNKSFFIHNCVTDTTISFLKNDINTPIQHKKRQSHLCLNAYYTSIKYQLDDDIYCIISAEENLLLKTCLTFVQIEFKDEEEKKELLQSTIEEVANIVCGLAISKFESINTKSIMSEPIQLDFNTIEQLTTNAYNQTDYITTSHGEITVSIISNKGKI
jgi:hypothetical protein